MQKTLPTILSFALVACHAPATPPAPDAAERETRLATETARQLVIGANPVAKPIDTSEALDDARRAASASERPLVERATVLAAKKTAIHARSPADPAQLEAAMREFVPFARDVAALYHDDADVQVVVAISLALEPRYLRSLRMKVDPAWARDGVAIAEAAARRWPERPSVLLARAEICVNAGEEELSCVRRYVDCLHAAPDSADCERGYRQTRSHVVAPRCTGTDVRSDLFIGFATTWERSDTRELKASAKQKLYVDTKSLARADFVEARAVNSDAVELTLRTELPSVMMGQPIALDGSKIVGREGGAWPATQSHVFFQGRLDDFCRRIETPSLPPSLVWP